MPLKGIVCVSLIGVLAGQALGQFKDQSNNDRHLFPSRSTAPAHFSQGLADAFTTRDLSLVGLAALTMYKPDEPDDQVALLPFGFDRNVSSSLSRSDGGQSLGSRINPATIQTAIFVGQLSLAALLDVATDGDITSRDYERPFVFAKTMLYTYGITEVSKNLIYRVRPDGSDSRAFFSGHTSGSFAASAFVYRELDDWIDGWGIARRSDFTRAVLKTTAFVTTYGWATYVGYSRIHDRKHYLSDVIIGAAVGTAIGNIVYDWHFGDEGSTATSSLQFSFIPSSQPSVGLMYHF